MFSAFILIHNALLFRASTAYHPKKSTFSTLHLYYFYHHYFYRFIPIVTNLTFIKKSQRYNERYSRFKLPYIRIFLPTPTSSKKNSRQPLKFLTLTIQAKYYQFQSSRHTFNYGPAFFPTFRHPHFSLQEQARHILS